MPEEDPRGANRSLVGRELEERRFRDCMDRAEYGVLSLADGGDAYGTPLSFGYADDLSELYFLLAFETKSTKRAYLETTDTASFVVTDSNLPDAWESVIVRGPVWRVPEDEKQAAYTALAETAVFPASATFEDYVDSVPVDQGLYRLEAESVTGRYANPDQLSGA